VSIHFDSAKSEILIGDKIVVLWTSGHVDGSLAGEQNP
jgi:hypothetical protein